MKRPWQVKELDRLRALSMFAGLLLIILSIMTLMTGRLEWFGGCIGLGFVLWGVSCVFAALDYCCKVLEKLSEKP